MESAKNPEAKCWGILKCMSNPNLADILLINSEHQIGRLPACHTFLNDIRLSSVHCVLRNQGDIVTVVDRSTNGTFINNQKIGKNLEA